MSGRAKIIIALLILALLVAPRDMGHLFSYLFHALSELNGALHLH